MIRSASHTPDSIHQVAVRISDLQEPSLLAKIAHEIVEILKYPNRPNSDMVVTREMPAAEPAGNRKEPRSGR
jgi:hypothetical protein